MKPFLTAEWKYLLMLNYEIDPEILLPFVPAGTELDQWDDTTYVSMVGFLFLNTRAKGLSIPFHRNFEEINLRFYVKRLEGTEEKRGVVFIKEIVPKYAIAKIANIFYNENYVAHSMNHQIENSTGKSLEVISKISFGQPLPQSEVSESPVFQHFCTKRSYVLHSDSYF